jgi:hypothetical protein
MRSAAARGRAIAPRALIALVAVALAGLAAVLVAGARDERDVVAEAGLPAVRAAATLAPGGHACRGGIDVAAPFSRVRLVTPAGPRLEVTVTAAGRTVRGSGTGATIDVGRVSASRVYVCVRNASPAPVTLSGAPADLPPVALGDPFRRAEIAVVLLRARPVSTLSQLGDMLRRAALFKAGWVGGWTFWILLAAIAAGLPALLAAALRSAYASECSSSRDAAPS